MKMQKAKVTERLAQVGAFAVVRVETVERGLEIADGLVRGGVPAMEISYTNANAGDVIAAVKAKYGDKMCVERRHRDGGRHRPPRHHVGRRVRRGQHGVRGGRPRVQPLPGPLRAGLHHDDRGEQGSRDGRRVHQVLPHLQHLWRPAREAVQDPHAPDAPLASGGINLDNLAEWVRAGVDTCGMGSLLTKGSADDIAKNAAEVRRIIDEIRAEMGE